MYRVPAHTRGCHIFHRHRSHTRTCPNAPTVHHLRRLYLWDDFPDYIGIRLITSDHIWVSLLPVPQVWNLFSVQPELGILSSGCPSWRQKRNVWSHDTSGQYDLDARSRILISWSTDFKGMHRTNVRLVRGSCRHPMLCADWLQIGGDPG